MKKAGMYLYKNAGDKVKEGEILATMYSETDSRLDQAKKILNVEETWIIN
jgi:thymidine phosphorylase